MVTSGPSASTVASTVLESAAGSVVGFAAAVVMGSGGHGVRWSCGLAVLNEAVSFPLAYVIGVVGLGVGGREIYLGCSHAHITA